MNWSGWTIERIIWLYLFLAFAGLAVQIFLFHYRGNFRHVVMFGPVIAAPIIALCSIILVFYNLDILRSILAVLLTLGVLIGTLGFALHVRSVNLRVGGWQMNNVLTGPPVMLPLTVVAHSLLGLAALYWLVIFR